MAEALHNVVVHASLRWCPTDQLVSFHYLLTIPEGCWYHSCFGPPLYVAASSQLKILYGDNPLCPAAGIQRLSRFLHSSLRMLIPMPFFVCHCLLAARNPIRRQPPRHSVGRDSERSLEGRQGDQPTGRDLLLPLPPRCARGRLQHQQRLRALVPAWRARHVARLPAAGPGVHQGGGDPAEVQHGPCTFGCHAIGERMAERG